MAHYLQHMRKRSHVRGVTIAAAGKFITVLLFAFILSTASRYIHEAQGLESPLAAGPFEVLSTGWCVTQIGGFFIGMLAGGICAHFSPAHSWQATGVLCGLYLLVGIASIPTATSWGLSAYWVVASPAAILLGAWLYRRREATNAI